ncbi:Beta-soluble NSF attachment protein [Lamellibrachia satsuma]|nr:Beta-soluble NSF attachment protein [Lamellibrachia satsuma]
MADNEKRALEFMAQAEKKQKSPGGFLSGLFGGGSAKLEESAELYVRAGNSFKMAKKWTEAGNAFCHAADVQLRLQSKHEAATHYIDAGNCYKKSDPHGKNDVLSLTTVL